MDCSDSLADIIRDLKKALKSDDLRGEVEKIVRKYSRKRKKKVKGDYLIKAGGAYYVNEPRPSLAYRILGQILEHRNYRGLCITRTNPENLDIYGKYDNLSFYWLSSESCGNCIPPSDLSKLMARIKEFIKGEGRAVILIDGIDSLVINTNFKSVVKFLQAAKDAISAHHGVLLLSFNMDSFDLSQRAVLNNELTEIPTKK